tara:strand:- start:1676 stop:1858 length:183 start_codon:yes stop_codon:yes gene_type:complete
MLLHLLANTLFVASVSISCGEAYEIIERVKKFTDDPIVELEVIQVLKENTVDCNWDANAD